MQAARITGATHAAVDVKLSYNCFDVFRGIVSVYLHTVLSLLLTHLSNRNQNIKDTSDTVKSSSNVHLYYEIDNEGRLRPNFTTKEMLASQL